MGLFSKLKEKISNKKVFEDKKQEEKYSKGLEKTRKEFTSELNLLTLKHNIIDEEYYEELEDILIMADIGVNTVMNFIDRLKKRVKQEDIKNSEDLKEIIVDEMFIIPEMQRGGYGSMLINAAEEYVSEHKLAGLTLCTNKYAPAPNFYRKNGFVDNEYIGFMYKEI